MQSRIYSLNTLVIQIKRTKDIDVEKMYFVFHQMVLVLHDLDAGSAKLGDLLDGHRTRMFSEF